MTLVSPKDTSGVTLPWLLEELKADGGADRHDMQRTHCGHATQEKEFLGEAFLGSASSGKHLGDRV